MLWLDCAEFPKVKVGATSGNLEMLLSFARDGAVVRATNERQLAMAANTMLVSQATKA
jgi:hypothetical protein